MVKRLMPWGITVVLLVGAWFVALATPESADASRAFIVRASIDERAEGRNIAVTVHDVRAAHAISSADGWRAAGTWIVVDLDAEAVVSQQGAQLGTATLTANGRIHRATERGETGFTMLRTGLVPGIPKTGSLAFQLPEGGLVGTATLDLAAKDEPDYDSIIALTIDLDDLPVEDVIEIVPVDWSGS